MINFNKKLSRGGNTKSLIIDAGKFLGLEITEEKISFAEVAYERYGCVVCEFSDMNIAKKFYNFRDVVPCLNKCPINAISFYRQHKDYYYDRMLLISGLNTKQKDCTKLFLDVCTDLGVDVTENDISRCEWLYSKAFKSRAQRSPLVVEFTSEEKRVSVFEASANEAKVRNEFRLGTKPRKPRVPRKQRGKKEGDEGEEAVSEEKPAEEATKPEPTEPAAEGEQAALVYRKIYINPFISLPYSMMYTACRELARKKRNLVCLPMSFYGRISLQIKEPVKKEEEEEGDNKASAVDDITEALKSLALDGKTIPITSPYDLWSIDKKFRSAALDKYFMYTDPYYVDSGYIMEPYEWFSAARKNEKRLTRGQMERIHPY